MNLPTQLMDGTPVLWLNPHREAGVVLDDTDMAQASADWDSFAPLLQAVFGVSRIDSDLPELTTIHSEFPARGHWLKLDAALPVAGSIKARGGFFEVLSHAKELAHKDGLIQKGASLDALANQKHNFAADSLHVASTGNLGLSIGLMGRALGFQVFVHMSADAKEWKKALLRDIGAQVIEYAGDYSEAVIQGRRASEADSRAYFVDDERSLRLFWGYSQAAYDVKQQLPEDISIEYPLFVAIPCGVGGAPGGIAYGLKALYGEAVHVFFAEPTQAPAVLLGMASGRGEGIRVQAIGLSGQTLADGLAVGKPSGFVCHQMKPILSGIFTVSDDSLQAMQYRLWQEEGIKCEPSAAAGLLLPYYLQTNEGQTYLHEQGIRPETIRYLYWATGGERVPEDLFHEQLTQGKTVLDAQPNIFHIE